MPPIRAVVFDLDETLIVEEGAVSGALRATAARVPASHGVSVDGLAASVRATARSLWRAHRLWPWANDIGISSWEVLCGDFAGEGDNLRALREYAPQYRVEAWGRALREHGVSDGSLAAQLAEHYRGEHAGRRVAYPETVGVLDALRPRYRLGLLTNGAVDLQRAKARNAGLEGFFHAITVSGEVGAGKPDARAFQAVLARLGVPPGESVMVGDNPARDIVGAQALGMRAIWVDRAGARLPDGVVPDARVVTLADVPGWVERWSSSAASSR